MSRKSDWPAAPRLTMDGLITFQGDHDYLVELARAGNLQASQFLIRCAADCLIGAIPLPQTVADWLADGLRAAVEDPAKAGAALGIARGKGVPASHKETIRGGLAHSIGRDLVDMLNRDGAPLRSRKGSRSDELGPAFVGAFEVARELGIETDPRALRDARYPRKRKSRGSAK